MREGWIRKPNWQDWSSVADLADRAFAPSVAILGVSPLLILSTVPIPDTIVLVWGFGFIAFSVIVQVTRTVFSVLSTFINFSGRYDPGFVVSPTEVPARLLAARYQALAFVIGIAILTLWIFDKLLSKT